MGSPAALEALIDDVVVEVGERNLVNLQLPELDLTNGDPLAALFSIVEFEDWALKNLPDPEWATLLGVTGSEGFRSYRDGFDSVAADGAIWVDRGEPYAVYDFQSIDLGEIPVSVSSDFDPPVGSVAFIHNSSKGPFDVVRASTGEILESRPGWGSIEHVVVMAPTEFGWQVYFSEVVR